MNLAIGSGSVYPGRPKWPSIGLKLRNVMTLSGVLEASPEPYCSLDLLHRGLGRNAVNLNYFSACFLILFLIKCFV
jgi:hypothetical protein